MAHPGGRPTKYNSEMCKKVIELARQGLSICEMAYELEIGLSTLKDWRRDNKEFSAALNEAKYTSRGKWMKDGRLNLENKDFNSTLWYMNMKNRFGWSDKKEVSQNTTISVSSETERKVREVLE